MSDLVQRRLAAIVSADIVAYSRHMEADETGTLAVLRAHRTELVDPSIAGHRGRIVKTMGDGLLLEFNSVVDAVTCAIEIQQAMVERNGEVADYDALCYRFGIHLGDVIVEDGDIFGDGVNLTARIEALADPGGIAISDEAHRQLRDPLDIDWSDGGEHHVKNISRAISIWRWSPPGNRPAQSATARPAQPPAPEEPSIAILPFDNMSEDREQEYFADGITEDIITQISKFSGLLVISRNSTFTYKGTPTKAQDVCRDLDVRFVLEGSVRKAGERVRISAQLIDGRSGGHIWAERYDRELADIFAVQDDVTGKIVSALQVKLVDGADTASARVETDIPEAYDCVLRGREQYRRFTKDANAHARQLYEKAIELDPAYAAARAGLAETFMHDWFSGSDEALDTALEIAQQARALDPEHPLVCEALGNILLFKRRYDEAFAAIRKWIEIEPASADAYANLAGLLHFNGEPEQVEPLIDKAIRLNPFYPFYYTLYIGQARLMMERYDHAAEALKRSALRNPEAAPTHLYLAAAHGHLGQDEQARSAWDELRRLHPDVSIEWVRTIFAYRRPDDLDRLLEGLRKAGLFV